MTTGKRSVRADFVRELLTENINRSYSEIFPLMKAKGEEYIMSEEYFNIFRSNMINKQANTATTTKKNAPALDLDKMEEFIKTQGGINQAKEFILNNKEKISKDVEESEKKLDELKFKLKEIGFYEYGIRQVEDIVSKFADLQKAAS